MWGNLAMARVCSIRYRGNTMLTGIMYSNCCENTACAYWSFGHPGMFSRRYGLGSGDATSLRNRVASFVESSPDTKIVGTPIRDWVRWESGLNPAAYARRMQTPGQWGGAIEIALTSHLERVRIYVYEPACDGGFLRVAAFEPDENGAGVNCDSSLPGSTRTVRALYGGKVHYDALVIMETPSPDSS